MKSCRWLIATRRLLKKWYSETAGNIAVIFAIAAIPVIGAVGTAVDYSKANDVKSRLQDALDAAVLAGTTQPVTQQIPTATAVFSGNYSGKYGTSATASFTQNQDGSLSGTASSSVQASFLGVFGITSIPLTAAATATPGPGSTINVCILLVNPLYYAELETNGGAQLNGPNCEIDVLSTQSPAAIFNTTLNVQNICIKGSTIIKNGGVNPPVQTNCAAISDPFAGTLPNVSVGTCGFSNQSFNGSVTLNPGVYCGYTNFNGTGTITLNPGLYVVSGATLTFNSGQTVIGNGVTFYLADHNATIEFNGGVAATLSAPTSGTYANILIFEPSGMASGGPITINGSAGDSFSGLFYLPSRDVTINSVSNVTANGVTMVFSDLNLNATNWSITPGPFAMKRSAAATSAYLSK